MKYFRKISPEIPQHRWFAWHPVYAWDESKGGSMDNQLGLVWLEYVWRKTREGGNKWRYDVIIDEGEGSGEAMAPRIQGLVGIEINDMTDSNLCRAHLQSTVMGDITCANERPCVQHGTPSQPRSKYWPAIIALLDTHFPKGKAKERGAAMVLIAEIERMLQKEDYPPGVSQWKNAGIKFQYDKFFGIVWPE